jgi:hypothetical protein
MPTYKEWDQEIGGLSDTKIEIYKTALEVLGEWDFFQDSFHGFSLGLVKGILQNVKEIRQYQFETEEEEAADAERRYHDNLADGMEADKDDPNLKCPWI